MITLSDITGAIDAAKRKGGIALSDLVDAFNAGATPQTQAMAGSGMSIADLYHAVANPDAVLNSPAASVGSGFAPIGLAGIMTYHGTPHTVERWDLSKVGTGQGAQSYGHGMYFAENPATAQSYRDMLSKWDIVGPNGPIPIKGSAAEQAKNWAEYVSAYSPGPLKDAADEAAKYAKAGRVDQSVADTLAEWHDQGAQLKRSGTMYAQDLPDEVLPRMLQWDKPMSEQPQVLEAVKQARAAAGVSNENFVPGKLTTGANAYGILSGYVGPDKAAQLLNDAGIPGLSYLDAGSRGAGSGTMNHVIWDQSLLDRMIPQAVP